MDEAKNHVDIDLREETAKDGTKSFSIFYRKTNDTKWSLIDSFEGYALRNVCTYRRWLTEESIRK